MNLVIPLLLGIVFLSKACDTSFPLGKAEAAGVGQEIVPAFCQPKTLRGHIAMAVPEGNRLVVHWQADIGFAIASLSPDLRRIFTKEVGEAEAKGENFVTLHPIKRLEFLRIEIWAPNFMGERRREFTEITYLEPWCRRDTAWAHTLVSPPGLLFADR